MIRPDSLRPSSLRPQGAMLVVALFSLLAALPATGEEMVNQIVLRVNDEILTLFEYEKRKETEIRNLLADTRIQPPDRQERLGRIGKDVMQQIFREMLIESFSRQNGITVSEREIDDAVQQVQERQGISTTDGLLSALEQAGLSLDELRGNLRQELMLSSVIRREVTAKIEVSDDELRAYYRNNPEDFQVASERHLEEVIVLDSSGLGTEEQLAKAQELHQNLVAGGSFEELVAALQDEGIATGIIDLGWLKDNDLEESLSEAAFAAPTDGFTPPVQARGGYHIVHVKEIKDGFVQPFEDVAEQILVRERQRRFSTELQKFMADLEETSYVTENLPADAVGYRALGVQSFEDEDELKGLRAPLEEFSAGQEATEATEEAAEEIPADDATGSGR